MKNEQLSAEAENWRQRIIAEYEITDDAGLLLLQTALEAFDRLRNCQRDIGEAGETITDRFGQPKPHPLLAAERDSRAALMAGLKALNLDIEPLRDGPGRPGKPTGQKFGHGDLFADETH